MKSPVGIAIPQNIGKILLFDFISHENMHLPFNEGYLRTVSAAFPDNPISFHACAGHIANLAPRVADLPNVAFVPCASFTVPFGMSRHNPVGGYIAARRCRKVMKTALRGQTPVLAVLLGVDANLYSVIGRRWCSIARVPLHMVLHGQLGDTMVWRSRNPFIRAFDLAAQIIRPLPSAVSLVALELGVKTAIAEIAPQNESVVTIEHPILVSEWSEPSEPSDENVLTVAFLGNARRSKGFEVFVALAKSAQRPDLKFEAIGVSAPDTDHLDVTVLRRAPSRISMSRQDYVEAVRMADLVCLPLHGRAYDFTASGTVSDAISALKPLLAFRNRTLDAIVAKYGPIGWLVDSEEELIYLIQTLNLRTFAAVRPLWVENLRKIRDARRPENLAPLYAELVR